MQETVSISCEEYRQLHVDCAKLELVKSYVQKTEVLDRKKLIRWLEIKEEEEENV